MTETSGQYDIAITGYACRLPGAPDARAFWDVLTAGRCVISQVGRDRFEPDAIYDPDPSARGKSYTLAAGQIDDIWGFDPGFFAISPREAVQMDPQQRVLLQVVWEALEHAGLTSETLSGNRTGVFVGASSSDYSAHFFTDLARADSQFMTGNTLSIISNRISYLLNLRGPSFTVDTACSSSFYALHEGAQALMRGEIDTAIIGGVNLLVAPGPFVGFSRATMLSPTGRCRAFDASADGYVRSEGAVVFVLKRLEAARSGGDPVRGILAGTGINSDGRTVGMAMPSALRQTDLLRMMQGRFGVRADRLAFVEAHGTGTPVGDPLEAQAIGAAFGKARQAPLPIGSAKSNFGHLEPASGLVGLLKAQMALERGVLPATLHVETPNPHIDFDALGLRIAREPVEIPPGDGPWYAGVNSFGFGGANAHALLRQPLAAELAPGMAQTGIPGPLTLSAASAESLARLARSWRDRIAGSDADGLPALVSGAAWRREALPHRLVALGQDRDSLLDQLDAHGEGRRAPGLVTGKGPRDPGRTAFVFSGNGSQWTGMGRHLMATDAAFRERFAEIAALITRHDDLDLVALIGDDDLDAKMGSARIAQPVLFGVQMALVAALGARGLRPDAVAGHSVGEIAAACTAGIVSLADGVRFLYSRSIALDTLQGTGGMAAISASAVEIESALSESGIGGVSVAGINSPRSVTVSGDTGQIKALLAWLRRKRRVAGVMLDVQIPYHSAAVEPLRRRMIEDLKGLRPSESPVLYASSTTGQIAHGLSLDTDYWWRNAREVVRFEEAIGALTEAGCRTFVEISPRPVLATYVKDTLRSLGASGNVARTMDQGAAADTDAAEMAARAYALGARIDRAAFFGPRVPMGPDLPSYPWNNESFRAPPTPGHADVWALDDFHPLIGRAVQPGVPVWEGDVNVRTLPWLADHVVDGAPVFPAAGYVEMALAAATRMLGTGAVELTDLEILRPLALDRDGAADVRVTADPLTGALRIEARPRLTEGGWALHAMGTVRAVPSPAMRRIEPVEAGVETGSAALYAMLDGLGLSYGPTFRLADALRTEGTRAEAAILAAQGPQDDRLVLNPAHLDAALHAVFPVLMAHRPAGASSAQVFLPVRIGRLRLARPGVAVASARVEVTRQTPRGIEMRLALLDAAGEMVASAEGLRLQAVRLRGRAGREGSEWRQRMVRLRAPDRRVALPSGWTAPQGRLRALGVAATEEPEPDVGALLIDAACRRIAWDACLSLADRLGVVAAPVSPLRDRLMMALEEDGLADPAEGRLDLGAEVPYPPLSELVASLLREAPDRAAELQDLMRLETRLPGMLQGGGATESAPATGIDLGAGHRAMGTMLTRVAADLAASWPAADRLSVLVLGAAPASLVAALTGSGAVDRLVLSSAGTRHVDLMRQTLPPAPGLSILPLDEALEPLAHDVVLSLDALRALDDDQRDRLADTMALSGLLVAAEAAPSLLQDLRGALSGQPIEGGAGADPGILLADAFRDVAVQPLASGALEARIVTARPRQQAIRAALPDGAGETPRLALLVLTDRRAESRHLAALVAASLVAAGMDVRQCLAGDNLALQEPVSEIIHLAHLPGEGADPLDSAGLRISTLRDIMAMPARPERVWVVTQGGRPAAEAGGPGRVPADAALWGAVRVLANEAPKTRFRLVDFAPGTAAESLAEDLCMLVMSGTPETEIVIDPSGMSAPRVEALRSGEDDRGGDALRLEVGQHAALDSLVWRGAQRIAPAEGEVEIEVRATGLNFRDLMWAQGLLPDEALEDGFAGATLGMECAGVIARTGKGSGFRRGEEVIAFAPACFATHLTVPAAAVARLPHGTSFDTAAAVPTVFVTAQYALATLANLRRGETLLVHGGAGGVGFAAIQIARRLGARVFATAGTPAKRRLLHHMGVEAAFDSRSLAFADLVMEATGGRGVDVVLNALAGEAMERSLACLAPFGRFIELGKRDFFANTRIGLRPFRKNLSYFGVDADQLLKERPEIADRLLAEIAEGFADGSFAPPPCQVFEATEIVDAFRLMQQSRHVGKIIVRPPSRQTATPKAEVRPIRGAWLVVGGLGGFGLATATWLAGQGVEALWLVSRSGKPAAGEAEALAALRAGRVPVHVRAADVTDRAAMQGVVNEIQAGEIPLSGVLHAAMVLDDALSADLDPARIRAVMAPKIRGAEILDRLTRDAGLDHFVLYSSVTTLFGNPGQLPYVAANSHLESLAAARRAAGLPGLAIAWGPIADTGYLARDERTRTVLARKLGARLLTAAEALEALGRHLRTPPAVPAVTVAPMRWRLLASDLALLSTPLFDRIDMDEGGGMGDGVVDILAMIEGLSDEDAARRITDALLAETARILRQPVAEIDPYQPLTDLGFDSLMAMDLKLAAEEAMGVTIPILSIGDGMTLAQLSARIVAQLRGGAAPVTTGDDAGDRVVSQHLDGMPAEIDDDIVRRVTERADRI